MDNPILQCPWHLLWMVLKLKILYKSTFAVNINQLLRSGMSETAAKQLFLIILLFLLHFKMAEGADLNAIAGWQFWGNYTKTYDGKNFDYLEHDSGEILAQFYGFPYYQDINSVLIYLLDPKYYDQKLVLVEIKSIMEIDSNNKSWTNNSHTVYYDTYWRERVSNSFIESHVSSTIIFYNTEAEDQTQITIRIEINGENFGFAADLKYQNDIMQVLMYNLYITAFIGIQLICGFIMLKRLGDSQARLNKLSLITLGLCSIVDFCSAMTFVRLIMATSANYYMFVIPAALYLIIFVLFDMRMMFHVWKSHNARQFQNPEVARKKLTTFYILFYIGLFIYLTLSYFFDNEEWFIIISHLLLFPQIVHNIRMGTRPSFQPLFILGFVFSRILVPIYDRGCPENYFKKRPDITVIVFILSIYIFSIIVLLMQYYFGSRFFVPKQFLSQAYNYRRKIKLNEENKEDQCAICLQHLFANNQGSVSSHQERLLPEVTVMLTPCNHKFHQECLRSWMQVKLECPACRSPIPQQ